MTRTPRSLGAVICDVCGHANAERLTFCQECGRRLKSREARVVAPTPPRGLPKVILSQPNPEVAPSPAPAAAVAPQPSPSAPAGASRSGRSRPESTPPVPPPPPVPVAPVPGSRTRDPADGPGPPQPRSSSPGVQVTCPTCGTTNPPMYRFCVTCGVTLPKENAKASQPRATDRPAHPEPAGASAAAGAKADRSPQPSAQAAVAPQPSVPQPSPVAPAPIPSAVVHPAPLPSAAQPSQPLAVQAAPSVAASAVPQTGRLEERIIGSPVVEIAPGGAPQKPIICPRCQGQCVPGARFCQFCGAGLPGGSAGGGSARSYENDGRPIPARDSSREGPAVARGGRGRLVVIEADGSEGMSFPLADKMLDVGRTEGDILVKEDPYVSPRHARLVPDGSRWLIRDLASTNGVYLRLKKQYQLQDADLLLLGQEVLQFQLVSEPEKGLGHANQHGTLLFGSPIASRSARLCQRSVEGIVRDVYYLHRDETVIGRETGDIVFTADPFLSRRHAMIRRSLARKEGAGRSASRWDFTLTDLDSSNGTFVAIRNEVALQHGDFVRVGQHLFRVDFACA